MSHLARVFVTSAASNILHIVSDYLTTTRQANNLVSDGTPRLIESFPSTRSSAADTAINPAQCIFFDSKEGLCGRYCCYPSTEPIRFVRPENYCTEGTKLLDAVVLNKTSQLPPRRVCTSFLGKDSRSCVVFQTHAKLIVQRRVQLRMYRYRSCEATTCPSCLTSTGWDLSVDSSTFLKIYRKYRKEAARSRFRGTSQVPPHW